MSERYTHQLLKVVVAQICQTIGWHSIQSTPLELMIDILDQYLKDITRSTHRYAELYNRTDPNLDDVALAYRDIGINLGELQEYLEFVDPIERPCEVPKYPLPKENHLNFLKPGSKEVLTRPVHIPEHMPPMLVDSEEEQEEAERRRRQRQAFLLDGEDGEVVDDVKPEILPELVEKMEEVGAEEVALMDTSQTEEVVAFKRPPDVLLDGGGGDLKKPKSLAEERRPTREISSVIMTTSGFISPAREGKLPDSKPPVIPEEMPKPPPPPPPPAPVSSALPVAKMDDKFAKKGKKKPVDKEKKKKVDKKKDAAGGGEKEAKSRPATPTIAVPEAASVPPPAVDDIKPPTELLEPPPKPPTPGPDIKPPIPELPPPIDLEKPPLPVAPIKPPAKPKKERPKKKKQQEPKLTSPVPSLIPNPGMDIGALFAPHPLQPAGPPQLPLPPALPLQTLVNQVPPPKQQKPKPPKPPKPKRTKPTKKEIQRQYMEQLKQFQAPLNAQNIIDMFATPTTTGKKPLPGLFQPPLFPPQQLPQPPPQLAPNFPPDNPAQTQLDLLQKLHPSLEITPAPGPGGGPPLLHSPNADKHKLNIFKKLPKKEPPPGATTQGPIIVIDDDKSPPHQPQYPITPMGKKRAPKSATSNQSFSSFQDQLSSPDFSMGMTPGDHHHSGAIGLGSSGSFREFSPPKTPSNLPKTPDIKLPSSSSSSTSWMSDSGKLSTPAGGPGPIFHDFPNFGLPPPKEEKKKKPRQKQPRETKKAKSAKLMEELNRLQQFQQFPPTVPAPSGLDKSLPDAISPFGKLLGNPGLPPGFLASQVRNPMFGMFPLPSGPGLIPENPLFPNPFPGQPSFLPTGPPFGMPPMGPRFDLGNFMRYPRPPKTTSVESFDSLDPETKLAHTPLDLQKSTCNVAPLVPPSLQIEPITTSSPKPPRSKKQQQQSSPASPFPPLQEQSLNLSTKSVIIPNPLNPSSIVQKPPTPQPHPIKLPPEPKNPEPPINIPHNLLGATTLIPAPAPSPPPIRPQLPPTPQQTVLPTQQPPPPPPITHGETIVIGSDSDTCSQSTVTMAAMGISPPLSGSAGSAASGSKKDKSEKRKSKEHKKDRKLKEGKEGKIKKKKDKKDKNKSKDRDRERPKSSHSFIQDITDNAPEPIPGPAAPVVPAALDDPALLEQIRRKEKKEKKKEKLKKEKRKEKERAAAAALESSFSDHRSSLNLSSGSGSADLTIVDNPDGPPPPAPAPSSVPKLMLKLGSNPSSRSATPEGSHLFDREPPPSEPKREASPELARISALVTRPPKLKTPGSKSKNKDDDSGKPSKLSLDHSSKSAGKLDFSATDQPAKPRPRGIQALPDTIDLFSVTPTHNPSSTAPAKISPLAPSSSSAAASGSGVDSAAPHSSKKPPKEPKSSKSHNTSASASLGVSIPAPLNTPINVQDADGNVVWICPACGRVDDGTPMIGCDGCDAWYHWVCVGIQVPPDSNEDWYCRVCIGKKQESHGDEKQKKRKKKDKKNPKD